MFLGHHFAILAMFFLTHINFVQFRLSFKVEGPINLDLYLCESNKHSPLFSVCHGFLYCSLYFCCSSDVHLQGIGKRNKLSMVIFSEFCIFISIFSTDHFYSIQNSHPSKVAVSADLSKTVFLQYNFTLVLLSIRAFLLAICNIFVYLLCVITFPLF